MTYNLVHAARYRSFICAIAALVSISLSPEPCSAESFDEIESQLQQDFADASAKLEANLEDLSSLLRRGDAQFFLGRFDDAVKDYDRMIALKPTLAPTHWQRGLALYFAGKYEEAAKQFERFYELDKSDRENGIWRFYAQVKQIGLEKARKQLLPYSMPDREPLPAIYQLCAGDVGPEQVLKLVDAAGIGDIERSKRHFYASLYVGLDALIVRQDEKQAKNYLSQALKSPWPRESGYGPNFMWHVARLSLDQIEQQRDKQ